MKISVRLELEPLAVPQALYIKGEKGLQSGRFLRPAEVSKSDILALCEDYTHALLERAGYGYKTIKDPALVEEKADEAPPRRPTQ